MKELDTVKLLCNFNNISVGTEGCIVHEYDEATFEVEFFDTNGDTIEVITTPKEFLELVASYNA